MDTDDFQKSSVRVFHDRMYDNEHGVDIYLPPETVPKPEGGYPVIFYIHGGAWHLGDKSKARNPCEHLAREGVACVATSYNLSSIDDGPLEILFVIMLIMVILFTFMSNNVLLAGIISSLLLLTYVLLWMFLPRNSVKHPEHIRSVARGYKWTKDNVAEYDCDSDNVFVMGHSAGGHLATLLSTNRDYMREVGLDLNDIKGCIGISGVYSDKRLMQTRLGTELLKSSFGDSDHYMGAFPVESVNPDCPPTMLLNAGSDLGLKSGTLDLHTALQQSAVWSEVHYYNDLSHWNICSEWQRGGRNERILDQVLNFMGEVQSVK